MDDTHRRVLNIDLVVCSSTANFSPMGSLDIGRFKVCGFRVSKGSYLLSSIGFLMQLNSKFLLNSYFEFINIHMCKILSIAHNKIFFLNSFYVKNYKLKAALYFSIKTTYINNYKEILSFLSKTAFINLTKIKKLFNKNTKEGCI